MDSSIKRRRSACFSKLFSENRPPNRPDRGRYPQYIQHINKKAGTELNFLVLSYRLFLCLIFPAKELQELVSKDIQTDRGHHKLQKMETFWQFFGLTFKSGPMHPEVHQQQKNFCSLFRILGLKGAICHPFFDNVTDQGAPIRRLSRIMVKIKPASFSYSPTMPSVARAV